MMLVRKLQQILIEHISILFIYSTKQCTYFA